MALHFPTYTQYIRFRIWQLAPNKKYWSSELNEVIGASSPEEAFHKFFVDISPNDSLSNYPNILILPEGQRPSGNWWIINTNQKSSMDFDLS